VYPAPLHRGQTCESAAMTLGIGCWIAGDGNFGGTVGLCKPSLLPHASEPDPIASDMVFASIFVSKE